MKKIVAALALGILLLPAVSFAAFDKNLSYGASGPAVIDLQNFLAIRSWYHGPITGNFFGLTKSALIAYQKGEGIQPATGFFGPLTRAVMNASLANATRLNLSISSPTTTPQASSSTAIASTSPTQYDTTSFPSSSPTTSNVPSSSSIQNSTPPPNTQLCNGTYWNNCPTGQIWACTSSGGSCHAANAQYCNGQYWNPCPIGMIWSCSSSGGACSMPPQPQTTSYVPPAQTTAPSVSTAPIVVPPAPSSTPPTPAQLCQQQHDQALASFSRTGQAAVQSATNNYNSVVAQTYQIINNCGAYGTCFGGQRNLAQQEVDQAQAELASTTAQYQAGLANIETALQTCLSAIVPTH